MVLLFLIGLHCSEKYVLNKFAFEETSVINWLFTNRGGMTGIFLSLTKVLSIDQKALFEVLGSFNLLVRCE